MNGRRMKLVGGLTVALAVIGGLGATGAVAAPGTAAGPRYTAGATGAGDAYFPYAGNGGYDVQHYDLDVTYSPPDPEPAPLEGQFDGTATIDLVATQDLDRFNLDLRGMEVSSLTVNGKPATAIAPPAPGAEVDGAAYWQVQDDAAADLGAHRAAAPEGQGRASTCRSSSSTAARPRSPWTSRRRSTAG